MDVKAGRTPPSIVGPNSASAANRGDTHLASSRTPAAIISFILEERWEREGEKDSGRIVSSQREEKRGIL